MFTFGDRWKWAVVFVLVGFGSISGLAYFSTRTADLVAGEWKIIDSWSENGYLARLNIREGVDVTIEPSGFLKAGRLGIDGIIGIGWCGWSCGSFTANGFNHVYRVTVGGRSDSTLVLVNDSPAAVIVAQRVK